LDSFQRVEQIYADELFDGRIGKFYDTIFQKISPNIEIQKNILGLLFDSLTVQIEKTPIESWKRRVGLNDNDFYPTMQLLNSYEIVRLTSNLVEAMDENEILTDYITSRFRLEIAAENRALVVGEMLSAFLKRAPRLMAQFYRRSSAIGLRELLSVFNCQKIPLALLDYSIFKERYKGAEDAAVLEHIKENTEKIRLPQIVYTAHTVAFYPAISRVTERERSAVALGFEETTYTDEDETVWIAAEIDSKLEATKELAEFWCDRLEMVALMCNFLNYKLWLVAPEGFTPEAVEVLQRRSAYGSSRKQVELLVNFLGAKDIVGEKPLKNEYEIVVPMGEDTEMIAAHAVEEIARKHLFTPKAINQIKTALVEACINATEHSLSPDRKIYQKFAIENDRIVITISNRGLRLADKKATEIEPAEGRRGWGLKLMRTLMDDVKIEQVDDGTRISMTKYLKPVEN
jgi:serine/threonine-protein kinase RsbW